jgi:hypothetical protein
MGLFRQNRRFTINCKTKEAGKKKNKFPSKKEIWTFPHRDSPVGGLRKSSTFNNTTG